MTTKPLFSFPAGNGNRVVLYSCNAEHVDMRPLITFILSFLYFALSLVAAASELEVFMTLSGKGNAVLLAVCSLCVVSVSCFAGSLLWYGRRLLLFSLVAFFAGAVVCMLSLSSYAANCGWWVVALLLNGLSTFPFAIGAYCLLSIFRRDTFLPRGV